MYSSSVQLKIWSRNLQAVACRGDASLCPVRPDLTQFLDFHGQARETERLMLEVFGEQQGSPKWHLLLQLVHSRLLEVWRKATSSRDSGHQDVSCLQH